MSVQPVRVRRPRSAPHSRRTKSGPRPSALPCGTAPPPSGAPVRHRCPRIAHRCRGLQPTRHCGPRRPRRSSGGSPGSGHPAGQPHHTAPRSRPGSRRPPEWLPSPGRSGPAHSPAALCSAPGSAAGRCPAPVPGPDCRCPRCGTRCRSRRSQWCSPGCRSRGTSPPATVPPAAKAKGPRCGWAARTGRSCCTAPAARRPPHSPS